jgi:hypothetical protein
MKPQKYVRNIRHLDHVPWDTDFPLCSFNEALYTLIVILLAIGAVLWPYF